MTNWKRSDGRESRSTYCSIHVKTQWIHLLQCSLGLHRSLRRSLPPSKPPSPISSSPLEAPWLESMTWSSIGGWKKSRTPLASMPAYWAQSLLDNVEFDNSSFHIARTNATQSEDASIPASNAVTKNLKNEIKRKQGKRIIPQKIDRHSISTNDNFKIELPFGWTIPWIDPLAKTL